MYRFINDFGGYLSFLQRNIKSVSISLVWLQLCLYFLQENIFFMYVQQNLNRHRHFPAYSEI